MALSARQALRGQRRLRAPLRLRAFTGGFSLVEALVASAILLMASAGVTGVVTASLRAQSAEDARQRLEQRVQAELARLTALPFMAPAPAPVAAGYDPAQARSLVQAVFPHALVARNTPTAFFVPAGPATPAAFTTVSASTTVSAGFVNRVGDEWRALPDAVLGGWAVWAAERPPACALRVTVTASDASGRERVATATRVILALRPLHAEASP